MKLERVNDLIFVYTNKGMFAGAYISLTKLNETDSLNYTKTDENCTQIDQKLIGKSSEEAFVLLNEDGIIISEFYDRMEPFREGLSAVKKREKWGYIDETGEVVIPIKYDKAWSFTEGTGIAQVLVQRNKNYYCCINKKGKELLHSQNGYFSLCVIKNYLIIKINWNEYVVYLYDKSTESCEKIGREYNDIRTNNKIIIGQIGHWYEQIAAF